MSLLEANWEFVSDTVMGGVSNGCVSRQIVAGRSATRLTGTVSLDNNGGFIQMASDLTQDGSCLDAHQWTGIELDVCGNNEVYDLRLRTDHLKRPWQSFRASFPTAPHWTTVRLPFSDFAPHKTETAFDPAKLRRMGIVAVGRAFQADIAVSGIRLF